MSVSMPPAIDANESGISSFEGGRVVLVGEIAYHRQQDRNRRGVVDDAGQRPHEADRRTELLVDVFAGVRRHGRLEVLNRPRPAHPFAQNHHREDGDGRAIGKARDSLLRRNACPRAEHHERHHDSERRDVDGHRLRDEQNERHEDDQEDQKRADAHGRHQTENWSQRKRPGEIPGGNDRPPAE
jgi:hypothetical protein